MQLLFANSQIEKICTSPERAVKKYGARCAETLTRIPGHYHPLTADRKGQWACRLQGGLQLVFVPGARGEMVIKEITDPTLTILKIVDYHH